MARFSFALLSFFFFVVPSTFASQPVNRKLPPRDLASEEFDRLNTTYTFDQLVDHTDPSLGTFKQRYWVNTEWYQPGGPIVLINGGEQTITSGASWLTNASLDARIAQDNNGTVIILEHRYFGYSQPFDDLSSESLKYWTIHQAVEDNVYFAQNVDLPGMSGNYTPTDAPWILTGGSYPGALVSWTMTNHTGVFYAGYSTSGVVQAITDFWQYYEPVRTNMPQNCSADVTAAIAHIDDVFTGDNQTAIDEIKALFGVTEMQFLDDVVDMINVFGLWQEMSVYGTPDQTAAFYGFCDTLEVRADGSIATADGWGVDYALQAWAYYFKTNTCPLYTDGTSSCAAINSHAPVSPSDIDITIGSSHSDNRAWQWMVCNQVGWFQTGAPKGQPSIVSSLIDVEHNFRTQCINEFPDVFTEFKEPSVNQTNANYGGWDAQTPRIAFANGLRDPWFQSTMSADASNFVANSNHTVGVSDGFHCTDDDMGAGVVDDSIAKVQEQVLTSMSTWLGNWTADWNANLQSSPSDSKGGDDSDSDSNSAAGHRLSVAGVLLASMITLLAV